MADELQWLKDNVKEIKDELKRQADQRKGCHGPECEHAKPEKQAEALKPVIAAEVEKCVGAACQRLEAANAEGVNALRATIHAGNPEIQRAKALRDAAAAQGGDVKFWPCPNAGCGAALTGFERYCPSCSSQLEWPAPGQQAQAAQ